MNPTRIRRVVGTSVAVGAVLAALATQGSATTPSIPPTPTFVVVSVWFRPAAPPDADLIQVAPIGNFPQPVGVADDGTWTATTDTATWGSVDAVDPTTSVVIPGPPPPTPGRYEVHVGCFDSSGASLFDYAPEGYEVTAAVPNARASGEASVVERSTTVDPVSGPAGTIVTVSGTGCLLAATTSTAPTTSTTLPRVEPTFTG